LSEQSKDDGRKDNSESKIWKWKGIPISVILAVLIIAPSAISILVTATNSAFESTLATLTTFGVSFCVGIAGASVYLSLLLITEKNIEILRNKVIKDVSLMTLLFLLSGGLVAASVQTSIGILKTSGVHAVFLLGFGWQGAISGISGSTTRQRLTDDLDECGKRTSELQEMNQVKTSQRLGQLLRDCRRIRQELEEEKEKYRKELEQLKAEKALRQKEEKEEADETESAQLKPEKTESSNSLSL